MSIYHLSRVLNHVVKSGSSVANTLGTLTVFYSGFGVIISKIREKEDCFNTVGAATLTGLLFKSTGNSTFFFSINIDNYLNNAQD